MGNVWIMAANPKVYNHKLSFAENGFIDWRQVQAMKNCMINDIIYIYLASPNSCIAFKTILMKIINSKEKINDFKFWKNLDQNNYEKEKNQYPIFLRLKLISELNDDNLTLVALRKQGYINPKDNLQCARKIIDKNFINYLNKF